MAYQTRGRDPLLDSSMTETLEKRGKELAGLGLLIIGAMVAAMILSYSPDDPSWMSAGDGPVRNLLGPTGATIAAPLVMVIGWAGAGIALVICGWGLRLALHRGEARALGRLIHAPLWLVALSLFAASLAPGPAWSAAHSFGLGGLFGDTVLATLLEVLPIDPGLALRLMTPLLAALALGGGLFVLGFSRREMAAIGRFVMVGLVIAYAGLRAGLGRMAAGMAWGMGAALRGASGLLAALRGEMQVRRHQRANRRHEAAAAAATRREPRIRPAATAARPAMPASTAMPRAQAQTPERAGGLLARMPALMRRPEPAPEPELVEREFQGSASVGPGSERVRERIAAAIRARRAPDAAAHDPDAIARDKPLTRGRGRGPDPLVLGARPAPAVKPEPPLTADRPSAATAGEPPIVAAGPAVPPVPPVPPVVGPRNLIQHPPRRAPQLSQRARAEEQPALQFDAAPEADFELPALGLLTNPETIERHHLSDEALEENARMLENVLDDYGVKGEIVSVRPGPVVTMYELEPAPGLKASRVIGLDDDIARSMSALSARVSTVPGRSVIGIELPNDKREMVVLRELLASRDFGDSNMKLPLALGKEIGGEPLIASLAKMPHLLIAGTTGSGKSVAINTMILSLLYKLTPDECRLIMIDPKMLELSVYDGIPHLLSPVVTDPKEAVVALKWVVAEMEERYRKMSRMGVRNIDGYNARVEDALCKGETFSRTVQTGFDDETGEPVFETQEFAPEKMAYIVVIVDEMADLMMVAGKEIEACIQRLAQMARASGIHLIMATQRPSVDVITGTIKANFPTRISFQVTSKIDSRTILGEMGAEQLLGQGDMLYMAGGGKITRCHGPFVSDEEVEEVVRHLKAFGPPDYVGGVQEGPDGDKAEGIDAVLGLNTGGNTDGEDALYDQAVQIALTDRKCSTSYIQRKLAIGYNKAARLVEQMEDQGIVSPANHVGKREILVPEQ